MSIEMVVLVTGISSGIGKACAEHLAGMGYRVYGGARRIPPEGLVMEPSPAAGDKGGGGFIRAFPLDLRQDGSAAELVTRVLRDEGGIGTLIHAAGYTLSGSVEDVAPDEALEQFQTNFFGAHRMYREVLPVMRKQGHGRIITIGSVAGLFPVPFQSMYSASKYALEALTEATRIEVAPFGIKVTLIDPGDINTGFTGARRWAKVAQHEDSAYRERCLRAVEAMARSEQRGPGPQVVIREVDRVMRAARPPVRVVVGGQYKIASFLEGFLPDRFVHWAINKLYS